MDYYINKNAYIFLCQIGGISCNYRMDPRNINYHIYKRCGYDKWGKMIIGLPITPYTKSEFETLLSNIRNIRYIQTIKYSSGLPYWQFSCDIINLNFPFTIKYMSNEEYMKDREPYKKSKWIYVDYFLIKKFLEEILEGSPIQKVDIKNEIKIVKRHESFYILCPYHTFNIEIDSNIPHKIKYYISIIDTNIDTIYDFTNEHIDKLNIMKTEIMTYLLETHRCITKPNFVRIYTYFPSQNYLGPHFFIDYQETLNNTYTRIVDDVRFLDLDTILRILNYNNNMRKYYVQYYTPCNSAIYKFAHKQLVITAKVFLSDSFTNERKIPAPDDLPKLNHVTVDRKIREIIKKQENYENIYYLQKVLIGTGLYYPFITQYKYMTNDCSFNFRNTKNKTQNATDIKEPGIDNQQQNATDIKEPNLNISEFNVIHVFYDFTRSNSSSFKTFGMLCEHNETQYIVNFVKRPLFKNPKYCTSEELKLIDILCETKSGVYLKENKTPYFVEIHSLPHKITNAEGIKYYDSRKEYTDTLFNHKLENKLFIVNDKYVHILEETKDIINKNLELMKEMFIDTANFPVFAFILYKYTTNETLKTIIRKYLDGIPKDWIFSEKDYPFIVIPDLAIRKAYENDNTLKFGRDFFKINIWHVDEDIYKKSLSLEYGTMESLGLQHKDNKKIKTVEQIIGLLNSEHPYPFTKGIITKFITEEQNTYPHTFKYASIELLDKLYMFINRYKHYMNDLMNLQPELFSSGENKLDFMNDLFLYYFHNTTVEQSVLHLHMRAKTYTKNIRHVEKNFVFGSDQKLVCDLDKAYMFLNINPQYFQNKSMYTFEFIPVATA